MARTAERPADTAAAAEAAALYRELGVVPVINALGHRTVLGGALLAPRVLAAMAAANRYFADMAALLAAAGRQVAELLGCEAAYVTPGCAAALTLGTAACIAGEDAAAMARLPDATGLRREVVIQARHRYPYDRAPTVAGAVLREAGDAAGTTPGQLAAALGPATAAVLFPAHLDGRPGTVPLDETLALAHDRSVPVLLDAASQIYPVERMRSWTRRGGDLVGFGARYFGGRPSPPGCSAGGPTWWPRRPCRASSASSAAGIAPWGGRSSSTAGRSPADDPTTAGRPRRKGPGPSTVHQRGTHRTAHSSPLLHLGGASIRVPICAPDSATATARGRRRAAPVSPPVRLP